MMPTDVVMPQMGESIAEGTIVRWIKKVGDKVERDEPLFEISTDKVDAEIPSPAAGVVTEIRVKEGETVPVNSVVAVIGAGRRRSGRAEPPAPAAPAAAAPERCRSAGPPTPRSRRRRRAGRRRTPRQRRPPRRRRDRRRPQRAAPAARAAPVAAARPAGDVDRRGDPRSGRRRSCARSRRSTTSTSRRFTAPASPDA